MGMFPCWSAGNGKQPNPKDRAHLGMVFGVWSDGRGAAEHENMHGGFVFGGGGAEGAPNTQNAPCRCFVCVWQKESTPTAQTRPCGRISAVGVKEEGQEMPPYLGAFSVLGAGEGWAGC